MPALEPSNAVLPRQAYAGRHSARMPAALALLAAISTVLAGCNSGRASIIGGNARRGMTLIQDNGCGSCHVIPGIDGASGVVGPPLTAVGRRIYLAGVERNTPEGMIAWLENPQAIVPGNAMPNMGLNERDARDIAAYLYTLQ